MADVIYLHVKRGLKEKNCDFAHIDELDKNLVLHWPISNLFDIQLCYMKKHHFRIYFVVCSGADFITRVMELKVSLILPIVSYGKIWDCIVYILYLMFHGFESRNTRPNLIQHLCKDYNSISTKEIVE